MTTRTPPPTTSTLHSATGVLLPTSEATALAAGDTVVFQNTGNNVLRFAITTAGTGSIQGINGHANQPITLSAGSVQVGPLDQSLYGYMVTITTATAVGSVGLYALSPRPLNGLRNPFESNATAPDAP